MLHWERQALRRTLAACPRHRLRPGDVHSADDFVEAALLIVEKGIVVVASGARSKRRIVLGFGSPGTLLPPPCSEERLVALADSMLISISPDVQRVLLRSPASAEAIVDALMEALRERQENLAQFASVVHTERLREKLLQLARAHGSVVADGIRVDVPLTHELLGQAVGSARETVTCALQALQREGFLVREGRLYRLTISPEILSPDEQALGPRPGR
jgi:CRP-like cAMP-binding protein